MGQVRSLLALPLFLTVAAAASAQVPTYNQVRQDHEVVDDAISAMSSSDMHATFNQISAVLHRSNVEDLLDGDANDASLLPPHFEAGLASALGNLHEDVKAGHFDELDGADLFHLLQVVDVMAMARPLELYAGYPVCQFHPEFGCQPIAPPPIVGQANTIASALRADVNDVIAWYNANNGSADDLSTVSSLNAATFRTTIADLRPVLGLVTGVESIDY